MISRLPVFMISAGLAGVALVGYALVRNEKHLEQRKQELEAQLGVQRYMPIDRPGVE